MLKPLVNITTSEYIQVTTKEEVLEHIQDIGIHRYIKELLADHDYGELAPDEVSRNPWIYDPLLTDEERMFWKLKGECHVCRINVRFHRDDCCFSSTQLMYEQMNRHDQGIEYINKYIDALVGTKIKHV